MVLGCGEGWYLKIHSLIHMVVKKSFRSGVDRKCVQKTEETFAGSLQIFGNDS